MISDHMYPIKEAARLLRSSALLRDRDGNAVHEANDLLAMLETAATLDRLIEREEKNIEEANSEFPR